MSLATSVVDPDLEPVRSGLFGSPGSGSFIHKKTPVIKTFSPYKIVKNAFRQNNFFIFDFNFLSVIRCLDLVLKSHTRIIYFAKHQKHISRILIWIRSFWGHPDPDPKKMDQIRSTVDYY